MCLIDIRVDDIVVASAHAGATLHQLRRVAQWQLGRGTTKLYAPDRSWRRRRLPKKTRPHHLDFPCVWHAGGEPRGSGRGHGAPCQCRNRLIADRRNPYIVVCHRLLILILITAHELALPHRARAAVITFLAKLHGRRLILVVHIVCIAHANTRVCGHIDVSVIVVFIRLVQAIAREVLHLKRPCASQCVIRHKVRFLLVPQLVDVLLDPWVRLVTQWLASCSVNGPASLQTYAGRHVQTCTQRCFRHWHIVRQKTI